MSAMRPLQNLKALFLIKSMDRTACSKEDREYEYSCKVVLEGIFCFANAMLCIFSHFETRCGRNECCSMTLNVAF